MTPEILKELFILAEGGYTREGCRCRPSSPDLILEEKMDNKRGAGSGSNRRCKRGRMDLGGEGRDSSSTSSPADVRHLRRRRAQEVKLLKKQEKLMRGIMMFFMRSTSGFMDARVLRKFTRLLSSCDNKTAGNGTRATAESPQDRRGEQEACNERDQLKRRLLHVLEKEAKCTICRQVVIEPTVGFCGHAACKFCMKQWLQRTPSCPVCQQDYGVPKKDHVLDNLVKALYTLLPQAVQSARNEAVQEQMELAALEDE